MAVVVLPPAEVDTVPVDILAEASVVDNLAVAAVADTVPVDILVEAAVVDILVEAAVADNLAVADSHRLDNLG